MPDTRIELMEDGIRILNLEVAGRAVLDFAVALPEEERGPGLVRAIEVGVLCLERAGTAQDLEFVRRQIQKLLDDVKAEVGTIPNDTRDGLLAKIGVDKGQVLAPIKEKVDEVQNLLRDKIDPSQEKSTLGAALREIQNILNKDRQDSIQGRLDTAIANITKADGSLVTTVKQQVAEAIRTLLGRVIELEKSVHGEEQFAEGQADTTIKGKTYEEEVVTRLGEWASVSGAEIEHVGPDNKPGDVLVNMGGVDSTEPNLAVIVEVKDLRERFGRKRISDMLLEAMDTRKVASAVYLSRTIEGLALEIGDWAEGENSSGAWVACLDDYLLIALRYLGMRQRLAQLRAAVPEVDATSITAQLEKVRLALKHIKNIKTKVTALRNGAGDIELEADALRKEVEEAIESAAQALRRAQPEGTQG